MKSKLPLLFGLILLLSGCATSENSKTGTSNSADKPFDPVSLGTVQGPVDTLTPFERTNAYDAFSTPVAQALETGELTSGSATPAMQSSAQQTGTNQSDASVAQRKRALDSIFTKEWFEQELTNAYERAAKVDECRIAAEHGDAKAQFNLGSFYENGQGVEKDAEEAFKWYLKSAEQNYAHAQFNLGAFYYTGIGVKKDAAEAVKWFRKAAEQGDARSQYWLGTCFYRGDGVPKDYVESAKWYRKAAEQGLSDAEYDLGISYVRGWGVAKDYVEAYKWLNLAVAQGHEDVQEKLAVLESVMTSEQIAEAQRRAAAFVPRKKIPGSSSDNSASPENPTATGTGFFITDDGYLISNYHVVKDATKVRLLTGAGLIDAKLVQVDAANDLALLKADGRFAPLPIAASRTGLLGGTVATVGFPDIGLQGFAPKLAKGEIASLSGAGDDPRYFQISVPVQPGNSGGALVDERGNVIGIVSAKLDAGAALAASGALPENVNYAVKSSLLLSFLESVPDVDAKLKAPVTADRKFEEVVKSAQDAAVLVLVY